MSNADSNVWVSDEGEDTVLAPYSTSAIARPARSSDIVVGEMDSSAMPNQNLDLRRFHQAMRGRYRLAVGLLLLFGTAGAIVGFKCGKKTYASNGLIQVRPVVPKVLYTVDEKGAIPMFESYVESQEAVFQSQKVIDAAMQDPAWVALGRGTSDRAAEDLVKGLTVSHEGEMLRVQILDPDPAAARVVVGALIKAYQNAFMEQDGPNADSRLKALLDRETITNSTLNDAQGRIHAIERANDTSDMESLIHFREERLRAVEVMIDEKTQFLASQKLESTTQPSDGSEQDNSTLAENPQLLKLRQDRDACKDALAATNSENLLPQHPKVLQLTARLARIEAEIKTTEDAITHERTTNRPVVRSNGVVLSARALEEEIGTLKTKRDRDKADLKRLCDDMVTVETQRKLVKQSEDQLDEAKQQYDHLTLEANISGRLNVLSTGDRPLAPFKNTQISFSAAGGFGGGLLGFGLVAIAALMDRRFRSPDQAEGGHLNALMLGLLPRLPDDLSDPSHAAIAAHCVHEIRTRLQIWSRTNGHRIFAITSPDPGAGKTSLTIALGASYAASNLRTLLVDCDLVAAGLTNRVGATIKCTFSQILLREGLVTEVQLAAARKLVTPTTGSLGKVLLEQKLISQSDLKRAIAMQEEHLGILDAMRGVTASHCVAETGITNLQILPVGGATSRDVPLLSPDALHRLFESLGQQYDVVIVDTGPILGSLEASLVAGTVDGVILTVCKGERRPMFDRAMAQLVTLGARVAGVVFNGASIEDIQTYGSGSGARAGPYGDNATVVSSPDSVATLPARFGPIADAVASCAPVTGRKPTHNAH